MNVESQSVLTEWFSSRDFPCWLAGWLTNYRHSIGYCTHPRPPLGNAKSDNAPARSDKSALSGRVLCSRIAGSWLSSRGRRSLVMRERGRGRVDVMRVRCADHPAGYIRLGCQTYEVHDDFFFWFTRCLWNHPHVPSHIQQHKLPAHSGCC